MSLEIGSRVGDYEITGVLGAGGMGRVYKVRNIISDRVDAMKVLLPDLEHDSDLADRFQREIKVQASLEHPNIAALRTALRLDNQLLMIMELVEGVTLEGRLRSGAIPVREAIEYISEVLSALAYAHSRGVVHRDIKPANMMLTRQGIIKLMDFGIAKHAADSKLTMTGTTVGSLYYMSPEQIKGLPNVDARSDLYSVGVSLYEMVTGKRPFEGDSQFAIMAAHQEKTPVPPIAVDPTLPSLLNDVILMAIAKDPANRFQSADAFRAALGSVQKSVSAATAATTATISPAAPPVQSAAAPTPTMPPPPVAASPSNRGLWITLGSLATIGVLIAVIQFGPWRHTSAQVAPAQQPPAAQPAVTPGPANANPAPPSPPPTDPAAAAPPPAEAAPVVVPQAAPQQAVQAPKRMTPSNAARRSMGAQAPPSQESAAPASPGQQPPPTAQPAAAPDTSRAQLQEVRERLVQVAARAGAVNSSLANLKQQQAAAGLGLRGDIVASESRLGYMIDGANSALAARDAPAARKFLETAETELEKLEKFLGR